MLIAVTAPVWGRPKTVEMFWRGVARINVAWSPLHRVVGYVAGSEDVHRDLAEQYGGVFVEKDNSVVSAKANAAVHRAWMDGADYVVSMGSDDLITPALASQYLVAMEQGVQYAGVNGCHMVEPLTRRALRVTGHSNPGHWGETIGAGRLLSRRLLDRLCGTPWPDTAQRGLDWRMTLKLQRLGVRAEVVFPVTDDAYIVDVKGVANMWSLSQVGKHKSIAANADYERVIALLSPEEIGIIRVLEQARCECCASPLPW